MGPWSSFGPCNDSGVKQRTRDILVDGPNCESTVENRSCPVDCVMSEWSEWSTCDSCTSEKTRTRGQIRSAQNGGTCEDDRTVETSHCYDECMPSNFDYAGELYAPTLEDWQWLHPYQPGFPRKFSNLLGTSIFKTHEETEDVHDVAEQMLVECKDAAVAGNVKAVWFNQTQTIPIGDGTSYSIADCLYFNAPDIKAWAESIPERMRERDPERPAHFRSALFTRNDTVDCQTTEWKKNTICSHECGPDGVEEWARYVYVSPEKGGIACPTDLERAEPCNRDVVCD
jgi:hypothetical protein